MEFKTTSTNQRCGPAGFTLVELLIGLGLSGLTLAVFVSVALHTSRGIASLTDSVALASQNRHAIDRMSQKIRQATAVTSFSPTSITVTYNEQPLTYAYRTVDGTLVEIENGQTTTLVENCNDLTFALYKRNPITNSFNQFPTGSSTNEAKLVQVSWRCQTSRLGKQSGSAEMASAKIVLRSK